MDIYGIFEYVTLLLAALIIAGALAVPIINVLYRLKVVRKIEVDFSTLIESRKEKFGTPIMGGLIIIIPVLFTNLLLNFNEETSIPLLIFLAAALLGGLDDLLNIFGKSKRKKRSWKRIVTLIKVHKQFFVRLRYLLFFPWYLYKSFVNTFESNPGKGLLANEKLTVQIIIGVILGVWIYGKFAGALWIPFFGTFNIGWLIVPFVIFTLLAMINSVNISDGMDGLAAGMLLAAFAGFFIIAVDQGRPDLAFLISTVVGALFAYLYFNIPPARIQFGDIGSYSMGAMLAAVAFALNVPLLLLIMGAPFVVEVSSSIIQAIARRIFGRRLLEMAPLHHHFEMLGWSEEKVVMRAWLLSCIATIMGLWVYFY